MTHRRDDTREIDWGALTPEARQRLDALLDDPKSYTTSAPLTARAETSMMESLSLLRATLEELPQAVLLLDESWNITQWLAKKPDHFGIDRDLERQNVRELFLPATATRWSQQLMNSSENIVSEETSLICSDGTRMPVEVHIRHMDANEMGVSWLLLIHDITQRRKLEEELRQAQKMEALGLLTSGIAHDLNNLLTIMLGHLELAEEELGHRHPAIEDIDGIRGAVERAAAMTVKLLAFARSQVVEPQIVDFIDVLGQLRNLLNRTLQENIQLRLRLSPNIPPVRVDLVQMEQLLINLVVNARDAIGAHIGKITISAEARRLDQRTDIFGVSIPPGDYLVISVLDDGEGMPPAVRARIFEPFYTTKTEGHGTGLGLSTCLRIVRQNEGYLCCESVVGVGTNFEVWLPRAEGNVRIDTLSSSNSLMFSDGLVMLVEDDRALRGAMSRALERYGYKVIDARNGAEALERLTQLDFGVDMLIIDVVMPDMGGVALTQALEDRGVAMPTLFISGYPDEVLAVRQISQHREFLPKPFTPRRLIYRVQEILMTRSVS